MRKAILVVALIGASFAGGAVVNGPCLGWAQRYLTHQLGGDAPVPVDDDLAAPSIDEIPQVEESAPGGALPAAPLPPLTATPVATTKAEVAAPAPEPAPAAQEEPAPIDLGPADPPLSGPKIETATDDVPAPPAPVSAPADKGLIADDEPESVAWKDAPDSLAPARPVLPAGSAPAQTHADPAVATAVLNQPDAPKSWSAMREKLREAGVSRYWIEGDPAGAVRLRCLIPLAGQRAVGQQFEADGATEAAAAETILRRIALWKATETP